MEQPGDRSNVLYVMVIVLTALFLRFFELGSQSLWLDEAVIYSQTKAASVAEVYSTVMEQEGHIGPLYHILNYLCSRVFGYSEWALRLPSAVYGTISVLLVYMVASALWGSRAALLSSALMAFSPLHVWYSQEARMYSLWLMLILAAVLLFIRMLEKRSRSLWVLLTVCASLCLWTFLNSVFVFAGLGLYLLISHRKHKLQWYEYALCIGLAVVTYLPGIAALLAKQTIAVGSTRQTSVFDLAYTFYVFNVGTTFGPTLYAIRASLKQFGAISAACRILSDNVLTILPPVLLFGGLLAVGIRHAISERRNESYKLTLVLLFVPSTLIFTIALFSRSLAFNVRYVLCALPFYLMLLSVTLTRLSATKKQVLVALTFVLYLVSLFNHYFTDKYAKLDFRSVVKYLHETMRDDDKAIILHEWARPIIEYYDKTGTLSQYCIPQTDSVAAACSIINHSKRIFYVKSAVIQQYDERLIAAIEKLLLQDFALVDSTNHVSHVQIDVYARRISYTRETRLANPRADHTSLLEGDELAAREINRQAH